MPSIGKVTIKIAGSDYIVSDESGQSYVLKGYGSGKGLPLNIDPRLDLTKPIYEQVQKLEGKRRGKKSRHTATAA